MENSNIIIDVNVKKNKKKNKDQETKYACFLAQREYNSKFLSDADDNHRQNYLKYENILNQIEKARLKIMELELTIDSHLLNANDLMIETFISRYKYFSLETFMETIDKLNTVGFKDTFVQSIIMNVRDEFLQDEIFKDFYCTDIIRESNYIYFYFSDGNIEFYIEIPLIPFNSRLSDSYFYDYSELYNSSLNNFSRAFYSNGAHGSDYYNSWHSSNDYEFSPRKCRVRKNGSDYFFSAGFKVNNWSSNRFVQSYNRNDIKEAIIKFINEKRKENFSNEDKF